MGLGGNRGTRLTLKLGLYGTDQDAPGPRCLDSVGRGFKPHLAYFVQ